MNSLDKVLSMCDLGLDLIFKSFPETDRLLQELKAQKMTLILPLLWVMANNGTPRITMLFSNHVYTKNQVLYMQSQQYFILLLMIMVSLKTYFQTIINMFSGARMARF